MITWYGKGPSGADVEIKIEAEGDVAAIARAAGALDAAMQHANFKPSDRFARPAYGGGGGGAGKGRKPDLEPPAGIVVPQHCGEPMKYIRYKKANAKGHEGRGVPAGEADMFVCHKDKQCEEVTSGRSERAFATFDMKPVKPAAASAPPPAAAAPPAAAPPKPAAPPAAPPPAPPAASDKIAGEMAWTSFEAKAEELGYNNQELIREIARGIPVVREETTRGQLQTLLDRMRKAPRRRAG